MNCKVIPLHVRVKVTCLVCQRKTTGMALVGRGENVALPFGWSNEGESKWDFVPVCSRICRARWHEACAQDLAQ